MAAYRSQPVDRVPIRVWNAMPWTETWHPSFQPILDAALTKTDIVGSWGMDGGYYLTDPAALTVRHEEHPSDHEGFREHHHIVETTAGELRQISLYSADHKPGMIMKHAIETPEQAEAWLDLPYVPIRGDVSGFWERDREVGERGIMVAGIGVEPIYGVQILLGSERLAFWTIEQRDLVRAMVEALRVRVVDQVQYLLEQGVGPVFGYVGPELASPPLLSPRDFREFVVEVDKTFTQPIKQAGGLIWLHSHGKMSPVIEGFMEMGVDCLNPIEPPPMGDLTLRQARQIVGDRMCLEGNLEADDMFRAPAEHIRRLVAQAIEEARGGGFILCPTSGFMEWPVATPRQAENYLTYIEAGLEYGKDFA
jgi:hypothetical protein